MKLDGRIEIAAPASQVWAFINDPEQLASCVPGARDVRAVDERTFAGSISAAVGPMQSDFDFTSVITRADFPTDLEVEMNGVDSMTRSPLVADVHVALESPEHDRTLLVYRATVNVKGRLAILGEMILRATAGAMIGEVARNMRSRLEAAP
jgi:carbon monoxide dehydrogenase subunit G